MVKLETLSESGSYFAGNKRELRRVDLNSGALDYAVTPDHDHEFVVVPPSRTMEGAVAQVGVEQGQPEPCAFLGPSLNIIPEKFLYFANHNIRFMIQTINIPPQVTLGYRMVEALVETPSGKLIQCHVKDDYTNTSNIFMVDSFVGSFKASAETGQYQLRVRLLLPMHMWKAGNCGVIGEERTILVTRNYFRESVCPEATSFQVEYSPWSPIGAQQPQQQAETDNSQVPSYYTPSKAWGITCDRSTNRLYYTDRGSHSFFCVDAHGQVIFKYQNPDEVNRGMLCRPTGICFDETHRRLIVADKDNHRISLFSADGQYISSFGFHGHANGAFNYPWDVAISPGGDKIAVTDSRNKRLQLFDKFGNYKDKFSVFESTPFDYKNNFDYPRGVTFNTDGSFIYITDFNSNNIVEIPVDLQSYRKILPDGKLRRPQGITVDALNGLLVCDSKSRSIRHLYANGNIMSQVFTVGLERIVYPVNVTLMGAGRVAILDAEGKIRIF